MQTQLLGITAAQAIDVDVQLVLASTGARIYRQPDIGIFDRTLGSLDHIFSRFPRMLKVSCGVG